MPKVSYTNTKGLHQESGSGFLPLGGDHGEVLGLGVRRQQTFELTGASLAASYSPAIADRDHLLQLGTLDVTTPPYLTATRILIEKVVVNVTTVSAVSADVSFDLSDKDGQATDAAHNANSATCTEIVGAGAAYFTIVGAAEGTNTEIDIVLDGTANLTQYSPNIDVPIAQKHAYLMAGEAISGNASAVRGSVTVCYMVV